MEPSQSDPKRLVIDRKIGNYHWSTQQKISNKVYLGHDIGNKIMVAIKLLDINEAKSREKEIKVMQMLKGQENTVNTLEILQTKNSFILIEEFCNGGDMRMYIRRKGGILSEQRAKVLLNHILISMKTMKNVNLVHRNIKPENFLFKDRFFKIRNFSSSKILTNYETEEMNEQLGTPIYMSPQILRKLPYTYKTDIWSIGVLYYEMIFGRPPWGGNSEESLLFNITNTSLVIPPNIKVSSESLDFIFGCLQIDESKRFTLAAIFNHPISKSAVVQNSGAPMIQISMDPDDKAKEILEELRFKAKTNLINLEELFKKNDTDHSKTLDQKEFARLIKELFPSMNQIELDALFGRFDINKDFEISFHEIKGILFNNYEEEDYDVSKKNFWDFMKFANLLALIKEFDEDKDTLLNLNEFTKLANRGKIDDSRLINELFDEIDLGKNKLISYEDLVRVVNIHCA